MNFTTKAGLKPIFIVFQILCLCPLPNQIIYTIFTIASFSVGFWMLISLLVISPVFVNGSLRIFIRHIVFIIRAITPMLIIAQVYLTKTEQKEIFDILYKVDQTFEKCLLKCINYKKLRLKYFISFFFPISILAMIRAYFIYHLMHHKDAAFRFYWFHCFQSLLVSRVRCIQTAFYCDLLNDRIQWIHQELLEIEHRKYFSNRKLLMKIMILRQLYSMLYDVSTLINKAFGWSLLVITITYFVDSIGNCYMYLLVLQQILPKEDEISFSIGLVSTTIALFTLCFSCGRCADNASSTSELIGKASNSRIRQGSDFEFQEFLLQVHHQNINVKASDFFKADMNLLVQIISAAITYIIVVIQA